MMKKIIILAAIAGLLCSCEETINHWPPSKTHAGKTLFDYAHFSVSSVGMLVCELELVNSWYKADEQWKTYVVETEGWFDGKTVRQDASDVNRFYVYGRGLPDADKVFDITMSGGLSLSEVGAIWNVKCSTPYLAVKNRAVTLERISTDSLIVTLSDGWTRTDYSFEYLNAQFKVVYPPTDVLLHKNSFSYTLSGNAHCRSIMDTAMNMDFETANYLTGETRWLGGTRLETIFQGRLDVSAVKYGETQSVTGTYGYQLKIYYNDITETYPNSPTMSIWYTDKY